MRATPSLLIGAGLTAAVLAFVLLGAVWTPHDPALVAVDQRLLAPSPAHPFGTDPLGRDVLSLVLSGGGTSLLVGLLAVAIGVLVGVPAGLAAAALGGWAQEAILRVNDVVFAFPALLLAILITAAWGPGAFNAGLAIGVFNIPVFAKLTHAAARSVQTREFVLAARAAGKGRLRIAAEHVLPNIANALIVQATIQFSLAILAEAALSYVGLGVQPPQPSWGRMLAEAQTFAALAPWTAILPGAMIFVAVLGLNLLGDGLRDLADPRSRGRA